MKYDIKRLILFMGVSLALECPVFAEDVLLFSGSPISSPDLALVSPYGAADSKMLKFRREFFIDKQLLESLPESSSKYGTVPVTAVEAIEIAMKDLNPNHRLQTFIVTSVQLLEEPEEGPHHIECYLVSALANGSEEQRIVMMNRMILTPKLKRVDG